MVLFTEHRLNDDPIGAKHLLNSLYIDEIVNDDSVIGNLESQNIAYQKAGFTKNETRNRLTSFTNPYHDDFIVNRKPIFFVGERYQYAELKKRVLNDIPVIFLNQPENSKEFVRLQLRNQIIVSDHQDSIETVFLHNRCV